VWACVSVFHTLCGLVVSWFVLVCFIHSVGLLECVSHFVWAFFYFCLLCFTLCVGLFCLCLLCFTLCVGLLCLCLCWSVSYSVWACVCVFHTLCVLVLSSFVVLHCTADQYLAPAWPDLRFCCLINFQIPV
jgi:hypothetical protein